MTRQLIADVPVGAYLSGGMDSGSITAVAARMIPRLHTFTGGFDLSSATGVELGYDERPASEALSHAFRTEHYESVMHAGDMEHVLPELIWHLEDLRMGQSYPNYYAAGLASKFVTVVLAGTGGDELFGGYPWRYAGGLTSADGDGFDQSVYKYWQRLVPDDHRPIFYNPATYAEVRQVDPRDVFQAIFAPTALDSVEDAVNASLYFEAKTFLHGLFVVEDKLSMAHSLETRVPFMDNDLVDFAMSIPPSYKLRDLGRIPTTTRDSAANGTPYRPTANGKMILRQSMNRLLPDGVTSRAKQGFSAPDASWFRGESSGYVDALLCSPESRIADYVSPDYVRQRLDEHISGHVNHRLLIWSLLSFEWWLRKFIA